jgi:NADPH2:quinone reductase
MRAAWYEHRGPARESLVVGEMPDPEPGDGEVRIAVTASGINPGDVKKRAIWLGSSQMPFPRVVPHSDGAGAIDAVGPGVDRDRVGERVWCYGAQSYRPFGTAADYVVVPDALAVRLPSEPGATHVDDIDEQASCLGIAGITAHRAVFADGSVDGLVVLVYGAAGGVGSIAAQLARLDGAHVIAVVRNNDQVARAQRLGAQHVFLDDDPRLSERIREAAPDGVHRVAEVDFASHANLDADVLAVGGVISSYSSSADQPTIPYWDLGFKDTTIRLLGSDDFPPAVKANAAKALTRAVITGSLRSDIAARLPLENIASAHELVEGGAHGRVVIDLVTSR